MRKLSIILLTLGLVRLFSLLGSEALVGYANQYDMLRSSACVDLWPKQTDPTSAHLVAPIEQYKIESRVPEACYWSSEIPLLHLGIWADQLAHADNIIALRSIGLVKALLLIVAVGLCGWQLWANKHASLIHAGIFAAVLTDPMLTLYLNTLYTEFSAALGLYLALCGAWLVLQNQASISKWAAGTCLTGIVILGCSRVPNAPIAIVLALIIAWKLSSIQLRVGLLAACLMSTGVAVRNQQHFASISRANASNTLLYAALPAVQKPADLLAELGLPAHCQHYAFTSWYMSRGVPAPDDCIGSGKLSRAKLAGYLLQHPGDGMRVALRGLMSSAAWRMGYVGEVAGLELKRTAAFSFASLTTRVSPVLYMLGTIFTVLSLLLFVLHPGIDGLIRRFCSLAVSVIALSFLISVLGDGFTELPRHMHLGILTLASAIVCLLISFLSDFKRTAILTWKPLALAIVVSGLSALALPRLSLAIAGWDHEIRADADQTIRLQGWVLDPYVTESVWAIDELGQRTRLLPGPERTLMRTIYPGFANQQYRQWEGRAQITGRWLEIRSTNRAGTTTVVDRIWRRD